MYSVTWTDESVVGIANPGGAMLVDMVVGITKLD